jgi:leucyl/phenylalanyl-tRNA--protein transferase
MSDRQRHPLPWVRAHDPLPDPRTAWRDPNGLLAAGADLSPARLLEAYRQGIFPWYSEGQPVLWWSPDPRMVLYLDEFRLHRSLARTIRRQRSADPSAQPPPGGSRADAGDRTGAYESSGQAAPEQDSAARWTLAVDRDFEAVMRACAQPRDADGGTWITEEILAAYLQLHRLGYAHSVEVRQDGLLVGGLYGVSIGRMFYGESMFTRIPDASKVALASLARTLRRHGFRMLDCQQDTRHLASLGARTIPRARFLDEVAELTGQAGPDWRALGIELPDA